MQLKDERLGLVLIGASLAAIAVITGLFLESQRDAQRERSRAQGLSLARLLSSLPYDRLAPDGGQRGALEIVRTSQSGDDFAYAALVGVDGRPRRDAVAPGVIIPAAAIPSDPSAWIGERVLQTASGRDVREFHAPVLVGGERVAHLRIGFFEPGSGIAIGQASQVGMLALPVFLLTPLAWFLIRRETRSLARLARGLEEASAGRGLQPVPGAASGELGEFVRSFNRFVELAGERAREVQTRETRALAASRVATYQKSRLEAVLEALPDAVLMLDETGRATFANGKLEQLVGVAPDATLGRKPAEWSDDAPLASFLSRYEGTAPYRSDAVEFAPRAYPELLVSLSAHPLSDAGDRSPASGTVAVLRDVTAATLARSAQGEFVTHVAHELKSPLNVMAMYSEELLGKDGESEEFRIEACNVLRDEVERVSMLVSTLLSIARIETGAVALERQQVQLQDFLRDALDAVSRGRQGNLRFDLEVPRAIPPIHVDKELLRVAVNNLMTNAIKYNRDGGEVILSVEDADDQISIRVRDTGLGIAEEDRLHVFEKFYRSEGAEVQRRGGHGLGLPLAREIVQLHGGDIEMESEPGEGSVFSIVLRKTPALMKEPSSR